MESVVYDGRGEGIYKLHEFSQMIRRCFPGAEIDAPLPTHASIRISAVLRGNVMMEYMRAGEHVSVRLLGDEDAINNVRKTIYDEHEKLLAGIEANKRGDISKKV